ncbi:MAG: S8 family serine peptidase [Bdellovibrionales bacterium]
MHKIFSVSLVLSLAMAQPVLAVDYSPQNTLIGATPDVQAQGNNGAGIKFGIVDTGGTESWVGFKGYNGNASQGRITQSTCISPCNASRLSTGNTDDNGHGTFVTSEIIGGIPSIGLRGVAPAGNAIEVKVLNAQGTGSATEISSGIRMAANLGAQVINLSIAPLGGTAMQSRQFYQDLASAVNYAASKNAVIVFAGGNATQALAGNMFIYGFSDAAIARTIFVGSTNANKQLSSFSNTPGTGQFVSTTGKYTTASSMWLMADGENIWGASNYYSAQYGYGYITQMSGTSMAAPQIAGAAGLLASRWPFLLSTGTIPAILESTATDLGAKGKDTVYGMGFLNVAKAMQPVGTLAVPVNGRMVAVSNTTGGGAITAGAAFGNMSRVSRALGNAVAYDSFMRGFPLYSASPVSTKSSASPVSPATLAATGQTGANARNYTDLGRGNWFAYAGSAPQKVDTMPNTTSLAPDPAHPQSTEWYYSLSQNGMYVGFGQGSGSSLSFNDARWNGRSAFFNANATASSALLNTVAGAHFATTGFDIGSDQRVALSIISSESDAFSAVNGAPTSARGSAFAYTVAPSDDLQVSLTSSFVNETNMLLGSYSAGDVLGMSSSATTMSFGAGVNYDLGDGYQIGVDASYATTGSNGNTNSLIGGTSRLQSSSFSLAFVKDDVTGVGDRLGVSIDKPLRVFSGSAMVNVPTGTDNNGNPIVESQRVNLAPTGSETDLGFTYSRPLAQDLLGSFNLTYRNDADNISGNQDAAAMVRMKYNF